jgi:hypothetical protein
MEKRKKLSSSDILKVYEAIWKEGPLVRYRAPDAWIRGITVPASF